MKKAILDNVFGGLQKWLYDEEGKAIKCLSVVLCSKDGCDAAMYNCRTCLSMHQKSPLMLTGREVLYIQRKFGPKELVVVGVIRCSDGLCMEQGFNCYGCQSYLEKKGDFKKQIEEAQYRKKMEDAGAHHLLGLWKVPVLSQGGLTIQ